MRTLLLGLLLATTATPVIAGPGDDEDRNARREAREERRAAKSEAQEERRAAKPQPSGEGPRSEHRSEPRNFERRIEPQAAEQQAERRQFEERTLRRADSDDGAREHRLQGVRKRVQGDRARPVELGGGDRQLTEGMQTPDSVRDWRRADRDRDRMRRPGGPKVVMPVPAGARPDVQAPRRRDNVSTAHYNPWRSGWRHDRRYDWRKYRERNRWRFNIGFYYDPFGWSYRRYPIGWRLWPSYYDSQFWLDDPWMYRLPPAYGPYRWVRYHNDALLVNIYSGQVVDVIYSFFW